MCATRAFFRGPPSVPGPPGWPKIQGGASQPVALVGWVDADWVSIVIEDADQRSVTADAVTIMLIVAILALIREELPV